MVIKVAASTEGGWVVVGVHCCDILSPRGLKHECPVRPRNMTGGFLPVDAPTYASFR